MGAKQEEAITTKRVRKAVKKDLFEVLEETGVFHAIAVNVQVMKLKTLHDVSKQWFVIVSQADKKKLQGLGFRNSEGRHDVAERDLTENEVAYFKKVQEKYVKILHNADGRIYEQKGKSLSKQIDYE